MKYISAQPDELFYAWQVEVMLDNFLSVGIDPKDIQILVGIQKHIGVWWNKLIEKYTDVGFFFYEDYQYGYVYAPSIRPHLMACHYGRFPELYNTPVFYHDCDILFTRTPDFSKFLNDDIWYLSDTRSYIGAEYIQSKLTEEQFGYMTSALVGVARKTIIKNQNNSGGAQYIIKNINPNQHRNFWGEVFFACERIYDYLSEIDTDIQKWTADMWGLLWIAWRYGHETKIEPYLNFSMATDTWPKWDTNLIYHNAGVVPEHKDKLFNKNDFRGILPYQGTNPYDDNFCSYYYYDQIIKTGKNSCLVEKIPDYQNLVTATKKIFIDI